MCVVIKPVLISRAHLSFPVPCLPSPSPCPRILALFVPTVADYLEFIDALPLLVHLP